MPVSDEAQNKAQTLAVVTGPSGAGRSTAIRALEDLGFEAIDNLPLPLFSRLFSAETFDQPVVVGIDARTRGFSADALLDAIDAAADNPNLAVKLVFLDCATDVLLRRFSETRRRHPLAPRETPLAGIEREIGMLEKLRGRADLFVDTTDMSPHDLRGVMTRGFGDGIGPGLAITIQSFSYKRAIPRGADMVLDCRFLRNPHWSKELRPLTGEDPRVGAYIEEDALCRPFCDRVIDLMLTLLPAYRDEGKAYFSLAFGCTGGRHRSVYIAETVANGLAQKGWPVSIRHRELERSHRSGTEKEVVAT